VLWEQDEPPDGLYIIESGILRAIYKFANYTPTIEESMVPGTLAGELSALSNSPRNATVVVERQAVLWKLSLQNLRRLELDNPALAGTFLQLILKGMDSPDYVECEISTLSQWRKLITTHFFLLWRRDNDRGGTKCFRFMTGANTVDKL
jgi:hypothetical protein